ncbi:MAG: response regulator [Bryobacteraceae bacterium]|nr:response regulator [Bryobacteraceae bacterium]
MSEKLLHVLLIEDNPGDAVLVQQMLFDAGGPPFTMERADSLLDGLDRLSRTKADVILLDLSLPDSFGIETFLTMKTHAPGTPIVLLTGNDNDAVALAAVEAGAQDYLMKDRLNPEALTRALRYAVLRHQKRLEPDPAQADNRGGKIIGILGASGGAGTTTVACHFAVDLRRVTKAPVLLADLDISGAAVAFLMKVHSPYSILDASENLNRLDATFWRSIVSTTPEGVDVISWTGGTAERAEPKAGRILHTLRFVRQLYAHIVLDLGRLSPFSAGLAREADETALVATAEIVSMYQLTRTVENLVASGLPRNALSVIQNQAARWSGDREMLEAVVDVPVRALLPYCREELNAAYAKGRLLEEGSRFRRSTAALAAAAAGVAPDGNLRGFSLRRLARLGARDAGPAGAWEN